MKQRTIINFRSNNIKRLISEIVHTKSFKHNIFNFQRV